MTRRTASIEEIGADGLAIPNPAPRLVRYCGLVDFSDNSHMSSCLQALYVGRKSRNIALAQLPTARRLGRELSKQLGTLFKRITLSQLWYSKTNKQYYFPYTKPFKFARAWKKAEPSFNNGPFNAQKFFKTLLPRLHDETKDSDSNSPYSRLFRGELDTMLKCARCNFEQATKCPFWQLVLDPSAPMERREPPNQEGSPTVMELIRDLQSEKQASSESCRKCGSNRIIQRTTVSRTASYLVLFINRFPSDGQPTTEQLVEHSVQFDLKLTLAKRHYELSSAVLIEQRGDKDKHKGPYRYTTLHYEASDRWVLLVDDSVRLHMKDVIAAGFLKDNGFIAIYRAVVPGPETEAMPWFD